ncbi:MAG: peptidase domain-containing ABC transporter [Ferruginibacter sp.]|nr:peptidase domain-containing ABC transporter [Ferruginibacter sp.]
MNTFPHFLQRNQMDCGPSCLYIICKHYGRNFSTEKLRKLTEIGKEGVNILGISDAAEKIGFRTQALQLSLNDLKENIKLPCILHWSQNHFVVLYKIKKNAYYISDPGKSLLKYTEVEFVKQWLSHIEHNEKTGIALSLEPTPLFYNNQYNDDYIEQKSKGFGSIVSYLFPYKKLIVQLMLGLLLGSLLQLILPFLTQSVIDTGVNTGNLPFVYVVLFAQLALFAGRLSVDFIRSWILYHISSRINISILTDFLIKLMKLPVSYFDSKKTGDIMQRMNDHSRIQNFLTGTSLSTLFSLFNLVIFSVVLAMYNTGIFAVFAGASVLYILWIFIFLKKRKTLDYKQFDIAAAEQSKTMEIVQGMQEIKLHGCEKPKRWQWERLQARTFRLGMKGLALNQWQQTGAFFINEGKNIFITFLAAKAVINHEGGMTLGGMLAIQYIIGQLNGPIEQIISFVQSWQLAKISLDRLNEIHSLSDEEPSDKLLSNTLPTDKTIELSNVSFTYSGAGNDAVLKNINLIIPNGKTTAIVGTSGSGKTTLLKLLLKFYAPQKGNVKVGGNDIENLSHKTWRKAIGVVMQESFIFNDSIAANIAVGDETIDTTKLKQAAVTANILEFIESLPLGFNTKIGTEGVGVSAGQKQRILIARAVYKNSDYIFFDEATNSLDANNEKVIMKNLGEFFQNRTVIVVAHRLSTVKNADQIVVLNKGMITEVGTHAGLIQLKGEYFTLVRNQLELGE